MLGICGALRRPRSEEHPEETLALAAKAALLTGVAVYGDAMVQFECDAQKIYEWSLWAGDKEAAKVIRPALAQATDHVPPRSVARDMAYAKLQLRILSAAEAVQAAQLHQEMPPEQQAVVLSAGGQSTGTTWTNMHKSPTEILQNAPRRKTTALPNARPRDLCALHKGSEQKFAGGAPAPLFGLQVWEYQGPDRIVRSYARCMGCSPKRVVFWTRTPDAEPVFKCAIMDVVSWFLGVLHQLWIDVSLRCAQRRLQRMCVEPMGRCGLGPAGENEALWNNSTFAGL